MISFQLLKCRPFGGSGLAPASTPGHELPVQHVLCRHRMHPILHSFKRIFLRTVHMSREYAAEFELTPARFDMVTVIHRNARGIAQNELRAVLGVCRPVVSRMLRSLEQRGFVTRTVYSEDRRTRWVQLTARGLQMVTMAHEELLRGGMLEELVEGIVSRAPLNRRVTKRSLLRTNATMRELRGRVFDRSTMTYPSYASTGERLPGIRRPIAPLWMRRAVQLVPVDEIARLTRPRTTSA